MVETEIKSKREIVAIVAPNSMAYRMVTESNILPLLYQSGVNKIFLLGPRKGICVGLPEYVEYRVVFEPEQVPALSLINRFGRSVVFRMRKLFGVNFGNLAYRFNEIHGFAAHKIKKKLSPQQREREELAGNFVDSKFCRVLPTSKWLYSLLYSICYSLIFPVNRSISHFFLINKIDIAVFWHVQAAIYQEYSVCVRQNNIKTVGVLGSWDRPTTKGPICPNISRYIVNSLLMKKELIAYHDVGSKHVSVVGWPHLDVYRQSDTFMSKKVFRKKAGLPVEGRVILFAANSPRLGPHEPAIALALAKSIKAGDFGDDCCLVVRPHPADMEWEERFREVCISNNVILMRAELGNIKWLANVLLYSDVIIATQGSVTLDAVALDKPVINIAFDDFESSSCKSVMWMYDMDHYRSVMDSGGVSIAYDMEMLQKYIRNYLQNPSDDSKGRKLLREWQFGPFDGQSSKWMSEAILQ